MSTLGRVSILIPACKEKFLNQTLQDLLDNCTGDFEIIVSLDGYWPEEILENEKIRYVHFGARRGMRSGINAAAAIATGEYLLKIDGHCMVDKGFDEKLKADMEDNWIVIPRRHRLDADLWELQEVNKPPVDYEYLCFPRANPNEVGLHGNIWNARTIERMDDPKYLIDENMSFQGSCWFMTRKHWDWLGGMSEVGYETFVQEAQELGMKTWLGGGKVMTNKKTWYAHLHKGKKHGRMYFIDKEEMIRGRDYSVDYWMNNRWPDRIHDIDWLIERFWPVPTWPEDRSKWVL
jgi:glycosyltransferase involved in cell wall biosynthesis